MSARVVIFHYNNPQSYLTGTSHFRGWCKLEIKQLPGTTTHFCCMHPFSEVIIYRSGHAQLPFTAAIMISKWHFADLFVAEGPTFVAKCWNQAWSREEMELSGLTIESAATLLLRINAKLETLYCGFCTFSWKTCSYYRSVSNFFKGEMVLQDWFLSKLKHFPTMILFLYKGSGEEVASDPKMARCCRSAAMVPCWGTSLCFWKQTLYHQPGDRGLSQFILLQMSSCLLRLLWRHLGVAVAPKLPSVLSGKERATTALLTRLGQAFDLLLKTYELL